MQLSTFCRMGGKARSPAKTAANRAKAAAFWADVRAGRKPPPQFPCAPPKSAEIARRLIPFCQEHGITRLELFGSVARAEGRRGSDVDLIATFAKHPGLRIVEIEQGMAALLGVPVDLLTSQAIEDMTNPYRKESIVRHRKTLYAA